MAAGALADPFRHSRGSAGDTVSSGEELAGIASLFKEYLRKADFTAIQELAAESPKKFTQAIPPSGIVQNEVAWELLRNAETTGKLFLQIHRGARALNLSTPFFFVAALATSCGNKTIDSERADAELEELKQHWIPRDLLEKEYEGFSPWALLTFSGWSQIVSYAFESVSELFKKGETYYVAYLPFEEALVTRTSIKAHERLQALFNFVMEPVKEELKGRGWVEKKDLETSGKKDTLPPIRITTYANAVYLELTEGRLEAFGRRIDEDPELFSQCIPKSGMVQDSAMWHLLIDKDVPAATLIALHRFLKDKKVEGTQLATRFTLIAAVAKSIGLGTFETDGLEEEFKTLVKEWVFTEGVVEKTEEEIDFTAVDALSSREADESESKKDTPFVTVSYDLTTVDGLSSYLRNLLDDLSRYTYKGGPSKDSHTSAFYARGVEKALEEAIGIYSSPEAYEHLQALQSRVHLAICEELRSKGWIDGARSSSH